MPDFSEPYPSALSSEPLKQMTHVKSECFTDLFSISNFARRLIENIFLDKKRPILAALHFFQNVFAVAD